MKRDSAKEEEEKKTLLKRFNFSFIPSSVLKFLKQKIKRANINQIYKDNIYHVCGIKRGVKGIEHMY